MRLEIDGVAFGRLRSSFLALLGRRGYLVKSPEEVARSIREIRDIGPGFDLYDLAEALAACDVAAHDCLNLSPNPPLPELDVFRKRCGCGGRNSKGAGP